jgi:hypothetical protein
MNVVITPLAWIHIFEALVHESARAVTQLLRDLLGLMPEGAAHQVYQTHDLSPYKRNVPESTISQLNAMHDSVGVPMSQLDATQLDHIAPYVKIKLGC